MKKQGILLGLLGLVYSSLIAGLSYLFIMAEKLGSYLLWETLPHSFHLGWVYRLVVLTLLFWAVYQLKKRWGNLPRTSHDLLHELGSKQTVSYAQTWHDATLALLILLSGAGVGPEATLLGAVIALSIWQADKLRYLHQHWTDFGALSFWKKLAWLFSPSQYLLAYPDYQKGTGKGLRNLLIANGLFVFWILMRLTDQPSFVTKLGQTGWSWQDLLIFVPLCLWGYGLGKGYTYLSNWLKAFLDKLHLSLFLQLGLGVLATFLVMTWSPILLFSGQHSLHDLVELGLQTPVLLLLLLSFGKLLFLDLSIWSGWTGGDIFPITFAAFLQGFAVAQIFPQFDSLFVVLVVSLSMAIGLLGKEWLAGIFISLFFPIQLLPVSLAIIGLALLWSKQKTKFLTKGK